jgi:hypothetical protein
MEAQVYLPEYKLSRQLTTIPASGGNPASISDVYRWTQQSQTETGGFIQKSTDQLPTTTNGPYIYAGGHASNGFNVDAGFVLSTGKYFSDVNEFRSSTGTYSLFIKRQKLNQNEPDVPLWVDDVRETQNSDPRLTPDFRFIGGQTVTLRFWNLNSIVVVQGVGITKASANVIIRTIAVRLPTANAKFRADGIGNNYKMTTSIAQTIPSPTAPNALADRLIAGGFIKNVKWSNAKIGFFVPPTGTNLGWPYATPVPPPPVDTPLLVDNVGPRPSSPRNWTENTACKYPNSGTTQQKNIVTVANVSRFDPTNGETVSIDLRSKPVAELAGVQLTAKNSRLQTGDLLLIGQPNQRLTEYLSIKNASTDASSILKWRLAPLGDRARGMPQIDPAPILDSRGNEQLPDINPGVWDNALLTGAQGSLTPAQAATLIPVSATCPASGGVLKTVLDFEVTTGNSTEYLREWNGDQPEITRVLKNTKEDAEAWVGQEEKTLISVFVTLNCPIATATAVVTSLPTFEVIRGSSLTQNVTLSNTGEVGSILEYRVYNLSPLRMNGTPVIGSAFPDPPSQVSDPLLKTVSPTTIKDGTLTKSSAVNPSVNIPTTVECNLEFGMTNRLFLNIAYRTGALNDDGTIKVEVVSIGVDTRCVGPKIVIDNSLLSIGGQINRSTYEYITLKIRNAGEPAFQSPNLSDLTYQVASKPTWLAPKQNDSSNTSGTVSVNQTGYVYLEPRCPSEGDLTGTVVLATNDVKNPTLSFSVNAHCIPPVVEGYVQVANTYKSLITLCGRYPDPINSPQTAYLRASVLTFVSARFTSSNRDTSLLSVGADNVLVAESTCLSSLQPQEATDGMARLAISVIPAVIAKWEANANPNYRLVDVVWDGAGLRGTVVLRNY